jgi:Glutamate racemase
LGGTHFSYYKDKIKKLFPSNINIIDGNIGTAKNLERILEERNSLNEGNGDIIYYNSGCKIDDEAKLYEYSKVFKRLDSING